MQTVGQSADLDKRAKEMMARCEVEERSKQMGEGYEPLSKEVALEKIK